jgi:hypothetical protein
MALKFEWDEDKSKLNLKKHGLILRKEKRFSTILLLLQLMIRIIQMQKNDILISVSHLKDGF